MARELRLDVVNETKGKGLEAAAAGVDHLRRETNRLESEFRQAAREAEKLDRQLLETRATAAALAKQFAATGGTDAGLKRQVAEQRKAAAELSAIQKTIIGDTEKNFRSSQNALSKAAKEFEKLRKRDTDRQGAGIFGFFADVVPEAEKAGAEAGSGFIGAFTNAVKGLPPEAQAGIVAGLGATVFAVAPFIGATISAAVIGAAGTGGLIGGIVGAAKDPAVKKAFSDFAQLASVELRSATYPFVQPLIEAAHLFGEALSGDIIKPGLSKVFTTLSRAIAPLANGLVLLVERALPGLQRAAQAAVPLFAALAREMPRIGAAVSDFFEHIANGSPGAIEALETILRLAEGGIILFGRWAEQAERVYDSLYKLSGQQALDQLFGKVNAEGSLIGPTVATSFRQVKTSAEEAADAVKKLNDKFGDLFGNTMNADEAADRYKKDLLDLKDAIEQNGTSLKDSTKKGLDNRDMIRGLVGDLERAREAAIANGDGTKASFDQANAAYEANLQSLRNTLIAMGFIPAEVDKIIDKYKQIPRTIETEFRLRYTQVGKPGPGATPVGEHGTIPIKGAFASGGFVQNTGWQVFGEKGAEIRWANKGDYITNARDTARMFAGKAANGGSAGGTLRVVGDPNSWLYKVIMEGLRTGQLQLT